MRDIDPQKELLSPPQGVPKLGVIRLPHVEAQQPVFHSASLLKGWPVSGQTEHRHHAPPSSGILIEWRHITERKTDAQRDSHFKVV